MLERRECFVYFELPPMSGSLLVWAPDGVPEVAPGDDLATLLLTALASEGFEPTRLDWMARAQPKGSRVAVNPPGGRLEGRMNGLGDDGALIIELDDGRLHHVRAGEVAVLG